MGSSMTKNPRLLSEGFSNLVRLAGFEPTTPWFVAKYSIQLSYSRCKEARLCPKQLCCARVRSLLFTKNFNNRLAGCIAPPGREIPSLDGPTLHRYNAIHFAAHT